MPASSRSEEKRQRRPSDRGRSARQSHRDTKGWREAYHDAPPETARLFW